MQPTLFDDSVNGKPEQTDGREKRRKGNGSRGNGTKDAVSRYSDLRVRLDKDSLNQNWYEVDTANYLTPRDTFNFVDLFAGGGGMSLGFRQAGFRKLLSVEIDKDASATLRRNFPESVHYGDKIEALTYRMIDQAIDGREVHVVCGGPPCQGFSVAGLRKPHDPRNQLFREYIRVVKHIRPQFIVMENVPGILTMQHGQVYREIIRQFAEAGYRNMSVRILEAAEFGVPQLRTRAIFVANRLGLANPYPQPQRTKATYETIEVAIEDLKDLPRDAAINHEWTAHSKQFEERISHVPPGGSLYETFRDAFKRQYRGVPSMTIKENHGGVHIHYEKNRVLSAREMARLQTFPDDYIFAGTMKRAYWQIGNAVPCLLAKNIATAVGTALEIVKDGRESEIVERVSLSSDGI